MDKSHKKMNGIRVIATGRTGFEQTLRKDDRVELIRARTPLDAIGELAGGDEGSPGDTAILIAPGSLSLEEAEEFAQTVRSIDPKVRTIGVGEEFKPLGGSGMFDALVAQDAEMSILEAALTGKTVTAPSSAEVEDQEHHLAMTMRDDSEEEVDLALGPAPAPAARPTDAPPHRPARLVEVEDEDDSEDFSAPLKPTAPPAVAPAAPTPVPPAAIPLGGVASPRSAPASLAAGPEMGRSDVEVIEVVLTGGDALATCLSAVEARLGAKVSFTPSEKGSAVADTSDGVVVRRRGAVFGALRAPGVPRESLERAAQWLGHWLALNEQVRSLRVAAYTDQLTGAYNRRYFDRYLERAVEEGRRKRRDVSLLLFDIDDFKTYNDRYGHAAGDEILVESVRLLRSVVRPGDRVCRVGGDEFAVIFSAEPRESHSRHPQSIAQIALRFQRQVCEHRFPKLGEDAKGTLTISGGMATFPWEAHDARALLETADRLTLASKGMGKNVITFGPGAAEVCETMGHEPPTPPAAEPEEPDPADPDLGLPPGI